MTIIPENLLRCVNPADRKKLGPAGQTAEEAMASFTAKSEKDLQKQICNLLSLRGIVYINPPMHKRSILPPGWPDFTFALAGVPVAIEAKIGKEQPSDEQREMHALLTRDGWKVRVVRSLEEVRTILNCVHGAYEGTE
jgi:hypothetical protein